MSTSLREEFLRFYHQRHNDLGVPIQMPTKDVADWWITTLKERIEEKKVDLTEYHKILCSTDGRGCNKSNRRLNMREKRGFNEALDTITRLLE